MLPMLQRAAWWLAIVSLVSVVPACSASNEHPPAHAAAVALVTPAVSSVQGRQLARKLGGDASTLSSSSSSSSRRLAALGAVLPAGTTITGSFSTSTPFYTINMFDPAQAATTEGLISVPSRPGNRASSNAVSLNDGVAEFETTIGDNFCASRVSVDVTAAGLVTYAVRFVSPFCNWGLESPVITLASPAFSGCSLAAVTSTFAAQGRSGGPKKYDNSVTGSVEGNVLTLKAPWLSFREGYAADRASLSAAWQLDCRR